MNQVNRRQGFTLIELLVVMAILVVFLGGLGIALTRGDRTMATQSAQRTMTTMIKSARSQAAMHQTRTRLIFHMDPPASAGDARREKYLRFVGVVRYGGHDASGNEIWTEVGQGVYLPRGVYFVPLRPGPDFVHGEFSSPPSDLIDPGWHHDRRTLLQRTHMRHAWNYTGTGAPPLNDQHHYAYIEFNSRGMTNPSVVSGNRTYDLRIVLAPATVTPLGPRFQADDDVLAVGGMVRRNGSFTLVHAANGFPEGQQ